MHRPGLGLRSGQSESGKRSSQGNRPKRHDLNTSEPPVTELAIPEPARQQDNMICKGVQRPGRCLDRCSYIRNRPRNQHSDQTSTEKSADPWVPTNELCPDFLLQATLHTVREKYLGCYLGALAYRFNRRLALGSIIERPAYLACRPAPLIYRSATMAEVHT